MRIHASPVRSPEKGLDHQGEYQKSQNHNKDQQIGQGHQGSPQGGQGRLDDHWKDQHPGPQNVVQEGLLEDIQEGHIQGHREGQGRQGALIEGLVQGRQFVGGQYRTLADE